MTRQKRGRTPVTPLFSQMRPPRGIPMTDAQKLVWQERTITVDKLMAAMNEAAHQMQIAVVNINEFTAKFMARMEGISTDNYQFDMDHGRWIRRKSGA